MFFDQKLLRDNKKKKARRKRTLLTLVLATTAFLLVRFLIPSTSENKPLPNDIVRVPAPAPAPPVPEPQITIIRDTIKKKETVSSLLGDLLTPKEIDTLVRMSKHVFPLHRIRASRPYMIRLQDGRFQRFEYEIDSDEKLIFSTGEEGFDVRREPIVYDIRTERISGTITNNLFETVEEINEKPELAMKLADIFGWDVDFILDIRTGDTFQAILEKRFRKGDWAGYGRILAAEFINQGKKHQAFLFEQKAGSPEYYGPNGKSLRRTFLKAPLQFVRISSGYSRSRLHPIKKVRLPHPGVDYAAPTGTPVKAVADGVVTAEAYDKANGRYIKIRHQNGYESAYLHFSRFARGMKKGRRVKQGQVIGYVGSTGYATGPHLDFRVKRYGKYVNPRKIRAPAAPSVPQERMEEFTLTIEPLLARLDTAGTPVPEKFSDSRTGTESFASP